jgi:hypothetical protein
MIIKISARLTVALMLRMRTNEPKAMVRSLISILVSVSGLVTVVGRVFAAAGRTTEAVDRN